MQPVPRSNRHQKSTKELHTVQELLEKVNCDTPMRDCHHPGEEFLPSFFNWYRMEHLEGNEEGRKEVFTNFHVLAHRYTYYQLTKILLIHIDHCIKLANKECKLDEESTQFLGDLELKINEFALLALASPYGASFLDGIPVPYLGEATDMICAEALEWADSYETATYTDAT